MFCQPSEGQTAVEERSLHQRTWWSGRNVGTTIVQHNLTPKSSYSSTVAYNSKPSWSICRSSSMAARLSCRLLFIGERSGVFTGGAAYLHVCVSWAQQQAQQPTQDTQTAESHTDHLGNRARRRYVTKMARRMSDKATTNTRSNARIDGASFGVCARRARFGPIRAIELTRTNNPAKTKETSIGGHTKPNYMHVPQDRCTVTPAAGPTAQP